MIRIYQSTTGPQIRAIGPNSARVIAIECHGMPMRAKLRGVQVPQIPARRIVQVG